MGARVYVPQLGRFEQPDPQPGASINAYAYTRDDPVNEGDPSGEHGGTITYDQGAIGEGEGTNLAGGVGVAPGAIIPPPVNMQVEEEFNAHPPWNAAYTFTVTLGSANGKASAASALGKLKAVVGKITKTVGETIDEAGQQIKVKATKIWDAVTSPFFESAFACVSGADEISQALDGPAWAEFPEFTATFSLLGCAMGVQGADTAGHIGKFTPFGVQG